MKKSLILFLLLSALSVEAQDKIFFQHQTKTKKQRKVPLHRLVSVSLQNGESYQVRMIGFTFDSLTLQSNHSGTISKVHIKDVTSISRDPLGNSSLVQMTMFVALGIPMAILVLPIVLVKSIASSDFTTLRDWAGFTGMLAIISLPPTVLRVLLSKTYDLQKDWKIIIK